MESIKSFKLNYTILPFMISPGFEIVDCLFIQADKSQYQYLFLSWLKTGCCVSFVEFFETQTKFW